MACGGGGGKRVLTALWPLISADGLLGGFLVGAWGIYLVTSGTELLSGGGGIRSCALGQPADNIVAVSTSFTLSASWSPAQAEQTRPVY